MKKITILLVILLMTVMANAQVLLDEPFASTFPNPQSASQNLYDAASGWTTINGSTSTTWSKTTAAPLTYPATGTTWINSGVGNTGVGNLLYVNYTGVSGASSYSYKSFTATPITSGVVYLSFLYKCTANGGSGSQIIGLSDLSSTNNLGATVYCNYTSPNLKLGVTRGSSTNTDVQFGTSTITLNTTYFIVMKYDFSVSPVKATLYVNPTIGGIESGATVWSYDDGVTNGKTARPSLQYLKVCTSGSNKAYYDVSGARISTDWADAVAPHVSALPKITAPSPTLDAASVGPTFFTAAWTTVAAASNYTVNVYNSEGTSLLKSQTTTGGTSTSSMVVTGLTPGTTYTYKVLAIATDQVNYANSLETALSNTFTTPAFTQLTTPTFGVATNIGAQSFYANWTAVTGAGSYVVKVYDATPTLQKTVTVTGQASSSVNITGLTLNTSYTYTVTAKGDYITYSDSNESGNSAGFSTLSSYPPSLNPTFSDGTWGVVVTSSPVAGTYPVFSANGWDLTHAQVKTMSSTGPKGEVHLAVLMLDKTSNSGAIITPTVASVAQIEIHSSATAGRCYVIQSSTDNGATWTGVGPGNLNGGVGSATAGTYYNNSASLEQIDIINTGGLTNAKFKITDPASGAYTFYQITTRTTTPTILTTPTVGSGDVAGNITATGFTANWSTGDVNAQGYKVFVYSGTTLVNTYSTGNDNTLRSLAITGLTPNAAYTYKVLSMGDGDNNYSDSYVSAASASFSTLNAFNITGATSVSSLATLTSGSDVTVANGGILTIDASTTINSLTIAGGGQVTLNSGITLSATNFTINSDLTNGTGTFVDSNPTGGLTVSGTTNVNQYMTSGRNWYISSPVASAPTSIVTGTSGNALYSYDEPSTSWFTIDATHNDASFVPTKGYVVNMASSGNVTFTGGALNTGTITNSSLTSTGATKTGFNLVGNPYPSYLNWLSVLASGNTTNMEPTMWYRTKSSSTYVFDTFNATAGQGTNNNGYAAVTGLIPPMQAFWVRAVAGQTGTLGFDNTMRSHQDQSVTTNRLKAPAVANATQQVLRLQVSNAVNSDEAIVLFNPNASDGFDAYDSEKMSNNNTDIPEIYTLAGTEQVAINGLNSVETNPELPLGFTTGASNTFTIKATEVTNFDAGTQIVLKDNLLNTEQDITDGTAYTFTSDVASTTSRFSVIFKSVGVTTGVQAASGDQTVLIYKNANNQIAVNCTGSISDDAFISVYNTLGQKLELKKIAGTTTLIDKAFTSGVYVVTVNNGGTSTTKKVILN